MAAKKKQAVLEPTKVELAAQVIRRRAKTGTRGHVQVVHSRIPVPVFCQVQAAANMAGLPYNSMLWIVLQAGMEAVEKLLTASEQSRLKEYAGLCMTDYLVALEENLTEHEVAEV